jgi:hypothetical protein
LSGEYNTYTYEARIHGLTADQNNAEEYLHELAECLEINNFQVYANSEVVRLDLRLFFLAILCRYELKLIFLLLKYIDVCLRLCAACSHLWHTTHRDAPTTSNFIVEAISVSEVIPSIATPTNASFQEYQTKLQQQVNFYNQAICMLVIEPVQP